MASHIQLGRSDLSGTVQHPKRSAADIIKIYQCHLLSGFRYCILIRCALRARVSKMKGRRGGNI